MVENVHLTASSSIESAGSNGFLGCNTVVDPIAIYGASLSVGAHAASGDVASFSSRGPVTVDASDRVKPDLTAPGVAVESTTVNDSATQCCKARAWPRPTWPGGGVALVDRADLIATIDTMGRSS
ncbi:MAG: S8 family serine peptidase [Caldilineaceae bacterium]